MSARSFIFRFGHSLETKAAIGILVTILFSWVPTVADNTREVLEVEISAGIDAVWDAFSTDQGLKSWVAPLIEVDFKVGGKWRANYNPDGVLGDETTIENTILSYDPKRMLSIRATGFPKGFPFVEAAQEVWTVFYFVPVGEAKTKITVVGLGYTDSEQSQQMRSFFAQANRYSLEQLNKALVGRSEPSAK